ncbi:MAG: hypothetical protein QS748_03950 [Candidatus Endonucleobacter bathymodioli]|uniref:Uncharacterized protein n=1 Tax=Candidatus Endonucleibacter bathymodioli TaxID=539814 RepID=A0AA90SS92_9GAMM|nr:hypothetical protein [Candidatus Endonucleobacter bathymodioli]
MRDTSNLVCYFFASMIVMMTSFVATNAKSCVDKCVQGGLGKMPFFSCKQKEPSEKNIHLKIIMTSNTECYSLSDLGIEYENITFHTGLANARDQSKIIPQNKSTLIVSKNNQNKTTYLIFDYEQSPYKKKEYPIEASVFMSHPADTETLSYLSSLTDALLKRKELLNKKDSSKTSDEVNIEITIDPHKEKDMDNIQCFDTSVVFMSSLSYFFKNIGISLSIRQTSDHEGKYIANYTTPSDLDIFRKENNEFSIKRQKTYIYFGATVITDINEIKRNRCYFYDDTQHGKEQEILLVTFRDNKIVLYAQPLPKFNESGIITTHNTKRVISTSPELELFLAYHSFSSKGEPYKMMFVYLSSKNTISIFYRPDTPKHYSTSPENDCDDSWENAIKSLWENNITDKLSIILETEKNSQQKDAVDAVDARLTKKHPTTIKTVKPNELSSQEIIFENKHKMVVKTSKSRHSFPDPSSKKSPSHRPFPSPISTSNHETSSNTKNTTLPQLKSSPSLHTKIKHTPTSTHLDSNSTTAKDNSDQQRKHREIQFKQYNKIPNNKTSTYACTKSEQHYPIKKLEIKNSKEIPDDQQYKHELSMAKSHINELQLKLLDLKKYKARAEKTSFIEKNLKDTSLDNAQLIQEASKLKEDNTKQATTISNLFISTTQLKRQLNDQIVKETEISSKLQLHKNELKIQRIQLNKYRAQRDGVKKLLDNKHQDNIKLINEIYDLKRNNHKQSETISHLIIGAGNLNTSVDTHLKNQAAKETEISKLHVLLKLANTQLQNMTKERDTLHACYQTVLDKLLTLEKRPDKHPDHSFQNPIADLSKRIQDQKKPMLFYQERQHKPK